MAGAYESIASYNLSTTTSTVTFNSIPNTFKHLQLRITARSTRSDGVDILNIYYNTDDGSTGTAYSQHLMGGSNAGTTTDNDLTYPRGNLHRLASNWLESNVFTYFIIDILDYKETTKNKVLRYSSAYNSSSDGRVLTGSTMWQNTSAISTIKISGSIDYGTSFVAGSSFSLYGIKG